MVTSFWLGFVTGILFAAVTALVVGTALRAGRAPKLTPPRRLETTA